MAQKMETALMDPQEREMVEYIWKMIPAEDKAGHTPDDVLYVLDKMDDYLEEKGLLEVDEATGEMTYLDGDVDETEQMEWIQQTAHAEGETISNVWIQLVMDGELQYGIKQGWYSEELD